MSAFLVLRPLRADLKEYVLKEAKRDFLGMFYAFLK